MLGRFIIDVAGHVLTQEDHTLLSSPLVGGVILFKRNYASRKQISDLCEAIRETRKIDTLIMVDQEGGRVQRFIPEFTRIPPMAFFGNQYAEKPDDTLALLEQTGWLLASELMAVGVDITLAPVLDLYSSTSAAIGNRAFARSPETVTILAEAFINGMRRAGMAATGKHFPGHGLIDLDTHHTMPVDSRSLHTLMQNDLIPFAYFAKNKLEAVLAAHLIFDQIDPMPVGYSSFWLQNVLRQQLGFKGVIFSDDLNMEGANISMHYPDRVKAALEAGCDFAMLCNNRPGVIQVIDELTDQIAGIDKKKWGVLQADFARLPCSIWDDEKARAIRMNLQALYKE